MKILSWSLLDYLLQNKTELSVFLIFFQFIEKFKEVKEATRIVSQKQQNGTLQSSPKDGSTGDLSNTLTPTKILGPNSPAYIPVSIDLFCRNFSCRFLEKQ